jgi:hypothetical protein
MSEVTPLHSGPREVTQESVVRIMARWVPRLRLERWIITVEIHVTNVGWPDEHEDNVAFIAVTPDGQRVDIDISKENFEARTEESLEKILVHELTHLVNWKYRTLITGLMGDKLEELALQIDEEICEQFAQALVNEPAGPHVDIKVSEES